MTQEVRSGNDCDLCGSRDHTVFERKHDLAYLRCAGCGFVFTDLQGRADASTHDGGFDFASFNEQIIEDLRDTHTAKLESSRHQSIYRQRLKEFEAYRRSGRLLEIGCATGSFLNAAREAGWSTVGVEPVASSAQYAISELGLDVHVGTLESADFEPASFDVVYSNAVLEHVPSPSAVIREASRLLRDGGLFYADTVNLDSYTWRFLGSRWKLFDPRMHLSMFTPATLEAFCTQADLAVRRITTHGVRFHATRQDSPRGFNRLVDELRKTPYSLAARYNRKGDNIAIYAEKTGG
jgi:2-polyprenyl-3-methyl-5-hydroxy-6-metoxy-1,4-benzoquinol methylase